MPDVSKYLTYSYALAVIYASLFIFEGFLLGRIVYFRHKFLSFQVAFLILFFFWAVLRSIFFAFLVNSTNVAAYNIVYWIPINIQFATFSLLACYYAHLHYKHKSEWSDFQRKYTITWSVLNSVFLILESVFVGLDIKYDQENQTEPGWLTNVHRVFSGTVFFLVTAVIGWYGWRTRSLVSLSATQTNSVAKLSFKKILIVSISLFIIFTIRCAYDFATIFWAQLNLNVSTQTDIPALLTFLVIFGFEILPTILVLILFGSVKSTNLGALSKKKNFTKISIYARKSADIAGNNVSGLLKAELFNDPKRYDSDDEATPFKISPSTLAYGTSQNSPYGVSSFTQINSINSDIGT